MTNRSWHSKGDTPGVRVLVVDEDPIARAGLAVILERAGDIAVVAQTADARAAVRLVSMHAPDVVLLDMRVSWADGLAAIVAVRALRHPPKVLVLADVPDEEQVLDVLTAGAGGLLLKDTVLEDIAEAVRVLASGGAVLSPSCAATLISHLVASRSCARRHRAVSKLPELTARERAVVAAVAQGKPNAEIAAELYLSEATVKTHLTRSFAKLDVSNRVQLTVFAFEAGLVRCGDGCRAPPRRPTLRALSRRRSAGHGPGSSRRRAAAARYPGSRIR